MKEERVIANNLEKIDYDERAIQRRPQDKVLQMWEDKFPLHSSGSWGRKFRDFTINSPCT